MAAVEAAMVDCMRFSAPVDVTGKIHGELARAAVYHLNDMPSARFNLLTPRMLVESPIRMC